MASCSFTERDRVKDSESFGLFGVDHTLWWRGLVADAVVAIGVCQVLLPEALHFSSLRWCDHTRRDWFGWVVTGWGLLGWIHSAAMENEVGELGDVWRVFVVNFVFPSIGSPTRSIPYCCIQTHWFRRELTSHSCSSFHLSNWNIIHIKSTSKLNERITTRIKTPSHMNYFPNNIVILHQSHVLFWFLFSSFHGKNQTALCPVGMGKGGFYKTMDCVSSMNINGIWRRKNLHDERLSPENGVFMEIFRWVKPEPISFFPAYVCASIPINIGLNPPIFASYIPQELKIYLVVVLRKHVSIWHLKTITNLTQSKLNEQIHELNEATIISQQELEILPIKNPPVTD